MLRKIRIGLAAFFFAMITLLFLDFTGTIHLWFGWMAKVQLLPAVLSLNLAVIVLLLVVTLVFGRVYCSVVCPLGVMQDAISHLSGMRKKKRYRFSYSPAKNILRYTLLALFVLAMIFGGAGIATLIAPYSAYGRIAQNLFAPIYALGNNALAFIAERLDSYAFYSTDVWIRSLPTLIVALVTFAVIFVLAWRNGRTWCNTICPVGTFLSFFSRFALLRPAIDSSKCKKCSRCTKGCKTSSIDYKNYSIDYSRCVACMNCIDTCKHGAIHYVPRFGGKKAAPASSSASSVPVETGAAAEAESKAEYKARKKREKEAKKARKRERRGEAPDEGRRNFLAAVGLIAGTAAAKAQEKTVDGGLAVILDKKAPRRGTPIAPPGAISLKNLAAHCTGCQLCVAACPTGVLRPSGGLLNLMQPESSYERGYCRPECTKCSEVCPTGAILKIDAAEKSAIQIGHAVWIAENCVPLTDGMQCGNCARHCPTGAITMVSTDIYDPDGLKIPVVNDEKCIGCGACENLCPARPLSAIYVEGHQVHRTI